MSKTFRLFISSTFSDFREERQVLHEKVFPKIDKYCIDKGYAFQPIDLRWGVGEEAQLDQKTLELCLNEVRACKHYPHPNFLIMVGNRYGWVPLPYAIEKDEFETILDFYVNSTEYLEILNEWYIEDKNHLILNNIAHAFVIKQRDPEGDYRDWQNWQKAETKLRDILQTAAEALFNKKTVQYKKYFLSATEAEVEEGIFQYSLATDFQTQLHKKQIDLPKLDKEYVYEFVRNITNKDTLELSKEPAKLFIDTDQTKVDAFQDRLTQVILKENQLEMTVELSIDADKPFLDDKHLIEFEVFMLKKLKLAIDKQIQETQEVSLLDQERLEQLRFKVLKTETFFGREGELKSVEEYINGTATQAFIVHGVSGIGKSSFIAKVISETEEALRHTLCYRFIGATASSSNIRTLLEVLIADLADKQLLQYPNSFEEDTNKFNEQIKALLKSIKTPTVILLDALDQLQHKDYLQWLPLELQSNLKIVLSMLDQEGYEHYYDLLKSKIDSKNCLDIRAIEEDIAKKILDELLKKEKRALTSDQYLYALKKLKESGGSPLYLKVAFEELKTWRETDTTQTLRVGVQEVIKEFIDNLTYKFHHDKEIVHKVLGLISASKYGLSEKEILDLLSRDEKILTSLEKEENNNNLTLLINEEESRRFPISVWSRLHEQLKPFINERLIDGQNVITFFHRQIDEAVRDYVYEANRELLHVDLADYFLELQDEDKVWDKRYHNLHMLDEVPYQLYKSDDGKRLKELLFDLEFAGSIYNSLKHNGFMEVLKKAIEVHGITEEEIYPWESFYIEKEHLITSTNEKRWRPNQSLFQLAYEDGDNSPLSVQADTLLQNNKINFPWLKKRGREKKFIRLGLLKVLRGHTSGVNGVETLSDGRLLSYSGCTLRLWSSEGEHVSTLEGHTAGVHGIKVLSDGRIVSYSWDKTLRFWNSDGEPLTVVEGHTRGVDGIETLSDRRLLSYSSDGTLRLWSSEGKPLTVLEGHSRNVLGAKVLSDGRILSYSGDRTLRLWSSEGEPLSILDGHIRSILGVEILSNGKILSYGDNLQLWSSEGDLLKTLEGHTNEVKGAEILSDGRILSFSCDGTLRLWSSDGEPLSVLEGHSDNVNGVEVLNDGSIVSYSLDKTLRLWSTQGKPLKILEGHTSGVYGIEILSDGRIVSYSEDLTLRLWSSEGEPLGVLEGHTTFIEGVKLLSDDRIISYSSDNTLKIWSTKGVPLSLSDGYIGSVLGAEVLNDGRIISYSWGKTLQLWSSEDKPLTVLEGHTASVHGIKMLSDGRILSYSSDGTLRLWSSDGEPLSVLKGHTNSVYGVKVLSDGRLLSYSGDTTLRLWSSAGEPLSVLKGHSSDVKDAEILSDGRILSSSYDNTLRLWSSKGEPLSVLEGHMNYVNGAKILSDGRILSYSLDKTLRLWSSKGESLSVIKEHTDSVKGVKILSDGKILSYSGDTLRLWSSEVELLSVLERRPNYDINGIETLNDGKFISYSSFSSAKTASNMDTFQLYNSEGIELAFWNGMYEYFRVCKIEDNLLIANNGKYLLVYNFMIGNKKPEELLPISI